jgi:DNA-binding beta-propeller fold protein YncE
MLPLTRNRSRSRFFSTGASAPPPPPSNAWDVAYTVYANNSFSVAAQETAPTGVFFKPDGAKMYVIGSTGDDVNEYDLGTPWDISTASYLQNFSVSAQDTTPNDLFFKPDGAKMYVVGNSGDNVIEYDLSTPWDVSTASYLQNFSVSAQTTQPSGLSFKPDGTKMYVTGILTPSSVYEYNLSSAWDISTASYVQSFSVAAQEIGTRAVAFKPDGTKMYVNGSIGNDVNEYSLSTPWDISTATFTVATFSFSAQGATNNQGIYFKPDGLSFFIVDGTLDSVLQYDIV